MTEQTPTPPTSRISGPGSLRILVVGAASLVLAISAAVAFSSAAPVMDQASAVGPGPADANGFVGLAAAASLENPVNPGAGQNMPGGPGGRGGPGFHAITISAKDGSTLSLKTEDGWTRKIIVETDTTITRAGATIALADLNVGDTIAFRQAKSTDGSFKVVEVRVIVPQVAGHVTAASGNTITLKLRDGSSKTVTVNDATRYFIGQKAAGKSDVKVGSQVSAAGSTSGDTFTALSVTIRPDVIAGEVTATTSDSITIKTRDGATVTVKVDSGTTYRVAGKTSATLADVTVGMPIAAEGVRASDTTFNAFAVGAGPTGRGGFNGPMVGPNGQMEPRGRGGFGGPGRGFGGQGGPGAPGASPAPSSSTSAS